MKILFVLEHYYPYIGGAERLFRELTIALVQQGYSVSVITTLHDSSLPSFEEDRGVSIYRVRCWNRYLFTLLSLPRIFHLARHSDLIHTTTYSAALPAWIVGRWLNKKVVVTFHEVWAKLWFKLPFISWWQKNLFYYYEQLILRCRFHRYVAVSKYTQHCLTQAGVPSGRLFQIYNGLAYESFRPYLCEPPTVFTYTYLGRLGISKGLDLLLPAAKQFSSKYPTTRLQLILPKTPSSFYQRIRRLIRELELEDHIKLFHNLSRVELYQTICQSSCVVIPSYSEGFCFAAAETMALGVPIISSQQGALQEVVSGRYIAMKNLTSSALQEALIKARQGEWDEIELQQFPLERSVGKYMEMYESL
ncbi:MAG: glycosyltransferase family 4 protein [Saprospiraceae bacterium]|nr:glycosyltransferase family 4 protein [Saprospiraceae bacterium]